MLHLLVVKNEGKLPAKNVVIGHRKLLDGTNFTRNVDAPGIYYEESKSPDSADIIKFPTLVPQETINITYRYFQPVTFNNIHSYVKSDEGFAETVEIVPTRKIPIWKKRLLLIFAFIGAWTLICKILFFMIFLFKSILYLKVHI